MIIFKNKDDFKNIKITKIKDWSICFNFEGINYMIHHDTLSDDYDYKLYNRNLDSNGHYDLEFLKGALEVNGFLNYFIKPLSNSKTIVYSQIDLERFALKLCKVGFATGKVYESKIKKDNEKILEYRKELSDLKNKSFEIQRKINELN